MGVAGAKQYEIRTDALIVPAGVIPLGDDPVTIKGQWADTPGFSVTFLDFADGTVFTGDCDLTFDCISLQGAALTTPLITRGASLDTGGIRFINGAGISQSGNGFPYIRIVPGATFVPITLSGLNGNGFFGFGGGSIIESRGAGAIAVVAALGVCTITADCVGAAAGGTTLVQQSSSAANIADAQAGMAASGGVLVNGVNLSLQGSTDRLGADEPIAIADAAATTITATGVSSGPFRTVTANSQNSVLTLSNTGATGGAFAFSDSLLTICKPTKEAFTYTIRRADGVVLVVIPALSAGSFRFQNDGANWIIRDGGTWV